MKVTTKSGFEYEFDENILEDWDTMEIVVQADSDNKTEKLKGITALSRVVFGDKLEEYKHYIEEKNNGRKPVSVISEDMMGILEMANQGNFLSSQG